MTKPHRRVYRRHTARSTREGALSESGTVSNKATSWAQSQTVGHTGAKFVLLVLADYADQEWSCFPSVKNLMAITEMGESSVRKALALLNAGGYIRVYGRKRTDGSQRSSRYQLLESGDQTPEPDRRDWVYEHCVVDPPLSEGEGVPVAQSGGTLSVREAIPYVDPSPKDPSPLIPRAARSDRATRIPDDFYPTPQMQEWFKQERLDTVITNPRAEHENFCDFWRAKAGADARKLDWPATWRRWMRTAGARASSGGGYRSPTTGAPYRSTTDAKVQQTLDLAEKFRLMEENQ